MDDLILAATDRPLPIDVRRIDDERVPQGMCGMGTYLENRLIARCAVSPEAFEFVQSKGIFAEPVPLVLAAHEESPGLQCRLFAVVQVMPELESEDQPEPWAGSVPGASYQPEQSVEDSEEPKQGMIFLGQIVRFARDRIHPDNLGLEAADVLRKLVEGRTTEVVDRALDDLLNGGPQR